MTRHIMRIELKPAAKKQLAALHEAHGMTQVAMMSRLVSWFTEQPKAIQAAVMGQFPDEIKPDIAKLILEHMAKGGGK